MPAAVNSPQDLFLQNMSELLYVERQLANHVLPQLGKEVKEQPLHQGIEEHRKQTKQHVANLERAFKVMGQKAAVEPSHTLDGLQQDHDEIAPNIQAQQLRDLFDAGACAKAEHLEIAAYHELIAMAQQMGQREVQQLLEENCRQDEDNLRRLEQFAEQMGAQITQAG